MDFRATIAGCTTGAIFGLLGLAAYEQASGIAHLVGSVIAVEHLLPASPPADRGNVSPSLSSAAHDHTTSARSIIARDPFDSTTPRPLDAPSAVTTEVPACEAVRWSIVVAADDPALSMAAMSPAGIGRPRLVRIGDDIGGGQKVEIIEWNRVVLSKGSRLCEARMFELQPKRAANTPQRELARAGGATLPEAIASKIRRIGKNEIHLDRAVVDEIVENHAELFRNLRVVPEQEGGRVIGVRLSGIRPDSLLGMLGIENGDRLQSINGFDFGSPEKVLEAYARLRSADHLAVQINRGGHEERIDVDVR
jgi:general secretion pathway protein C